VTLLALIRHGATAWNEQGIVQGRNDVPLSANGRDEVSKWTIPLELKSYVWVSSPLSRALETADLLSGSRPPTDDRLVEMDWAIWEGRTLPDLRSELGDLMAAWEAEGLDFRSPGGESPREVQQRVKPFLSARKNLGENTIAVCHKGVIRAIYALAIGWDMKTKPPRKLKDGCAQIFEIDLDGNPKVHELDVALGSAIG
jgi:broad specificity phosphatase PhoE